MELEEDAKADLGEELFCHQLRRQKLDRAYIESQKVGKRAVCGVIECSSTMMMLTHF